MRKLWFPLYAALLMLLAACAGNSLGPAATATTAATATPTQPVVPTKDAAAVEMVCKVVSTVPTPSPTEISKFPPPGPDDWTLGKESAVLTVIEYSDYQ